MARTDTQDEHKTHLDMDESTAPFFKPVRVAQQNIADFLNNTFLPQFVKAYDATNPPVSKYGSVYYNYQTEAPAGKWTIRYDPDDPTDADFCRFEFKSNPTRKKNSKKPTPKKKLQNYPTDNIDWIRFDHYHRFIQTLPEFVTHAQKDAEFVLESETSAQALLNEYNSALRQAHEESTLEEMLEGIRRHDLDGVSEVLADDEDDSKDVFMMLKNSVHTSDGKELRDTDLEVTCSDGEIALIRVHRGYQDAEYTDDNYYDNAYVVGMDDTDARFFIHRLPARKKKIKQKTSDWTVSEVREEMGFVETYDPDSYQEMEFGKPYRLQGDLKAVRRDYDAALEDYLETACRRARWDYEKEYVEQFVAERGLNDTDDASDPLTRVTMSNSFTYDGTDWTPRVRINTLTDVNNDRSKTQILKEIQEALGYTETEVRDEQERRGIGRLTHTKREQILRDFLREEFYEWCDKNADIPSEEVDEAVAEARAEFTDTQQVNVVFGNHLTIFSDATPHPGIGVRNTILVSEESNVFIIHDEHQQKHLQLSKGVYEIDFLDRHETPWMFQNE